MYSVQLLNHVQLFATPWTAAPWTAACQAFLSSINFWSLFKLMSIESVMPSNHLILSSPSPPSFTLSQHQNLFQCVSSSHLVAKVIELQLQHFNICPSNESLDGHLSCFCSLAFIHSAYEHFHHLVNLSEFMLSVNFRY